MNKARDCTNCKHNQRPYTPYIYDEPCEYCGRILNRDTGEYSDPTEWEPIETKGE